MMKVMSLILQLRVLPTMSNLVDHSSLRSESSFSNEDSPKHALLGKMKDDAKDWLRSTKPTTVTWESSTKASDLDF